MSNLKHSSPKNKSHHLFTLIFFKCMYMAEMFPYNGSQWGPILFGYQHSSKYLLLYSAEKRFAGLE